MKQIISFDNENRSTMVSFLGKVPNNKAGWKVIQKLKSIYGSLQLYGRNPNRKQFTNCNKEKHRRFRSNLPVRLGTTIAIYRRQPDYWKTHPGA